MKFLQSIDNQKLVVVFCVIPIAAKWDYNGQRNQNDVSYEEFRGVVRRVADTGLCELLETAGWFSEADVNDVSIMTDGVHLAPAGHRKYKDQLMRSLSAYGLLY